jgi:hypothetical protein
VIVAEKRGLKRYRSLANLLARERQPKLTEAMIAKWARANRKRTGRWPGHMDGEFPGSGGETWAAVEAALKQRSRSGRAAIRFTG